MGRRPQPKSAKTPARKPASKPTVGGVRNRQQTEERILRAVGTILAERGFGNVRINEIARVAGVDKVLIYRYFGGLGELIRAYGEQGRFWPTTDELTNGDVQSLMSMPPAQRAAAMLCRHRRAIQSRPESLAILAWETVTRNELTIALEEQREQQALELLRSFGGDVPDHVDSQACVALLSAGLTYLTLRSCHIPNFCGVSLESSEGWERLEHAVEAMITGVLQAESQSQQSAGGAEAGGSLPRSNPVKRNHKKGT